jgi:hypothetical protein
MNSAEPLFFPLNGLLLRRLLYLYQVATGVIEDG